MNRLIISLFVVIVLVGCDSKHNPFYNKEFTFAIVSDTHIGGNEYASEDLQRVVDDINNNPEIEFIILPGDITQLGTDDELKEAKRILTQLDKPWYVTPGNHDTKWSESGCNSFRRIFGYERFVFEAHGFVFAGCSSGPNMRMGPGMVAREDIIWLDSIVQEVKTSQKPFVFVNHYPLDEGLVNYEKVLDIIKQADTRAFFCGHGHVNKAYDFDGIPGTMSRSTLRVSDPEGAYNIVKVRNDSMYFYDKKPSKEDMVMWRSHSLQSHRPFVDTSSQFMANANPFLPKGGSVEVVWKYQDDSDIGSGVLCDDRYCYYTNTQGEAIVINKDNGKEKWSYQTSGKIFTMPAVNTDKVIITSTDGGVYCLAKATGDLLWEWKDKKALVAHPVVDGDRVYVGTSSGHFISLDLENGSELWDYEGVDGFVECKPAIDDETVYFGSWGNKFYALDKMTGQEKWVWTTEKGRLYSPAACFPVYTEDRVFIVAPDRHTTAIDKSSGKTIWRTNNFKGRESISISEAKDQIFIKTMQDTLVAYNTTTDKMVVDWAVDCDFGYEISPTPTAQKGNTIFIPTDEGELYAFDRLSGDVIWKTRISKALVNPVFALNENEVIASNMDGMVYRLKYLPN